MIRWFAVHPIAANILMCAILGFGFMAILGMKTEVIPNVQMDWLHVTVPFPGVASHNIEQLGIGQLERQIEGLAGVDEVSTSIQQGRLELQVFLSPNISRNSTVLADVRAFLDVLDRPSGSPAPSVFRVRIEPAVAALAIVGADHYDDLVILSQRVREALESLPEVGQVDFYHAADQEIIVALDPLALSQFRIAPGEVAHQLRLHQQSLDLGSFSQAGHQLSLTSYYDTPADQIGNPLIRQLPDGRQVFLRDVAKVLDPTAVDGHKLNGKKAVLLTVKSSASTGLVQLSDRLHQFIDEQQHWLPQGVQFEVWQDTSKYYKARIGILIESGLYGFCLLFIVLAMALHWRMAVWVSLGVPVAMLGGFIVLWAGGFSLNMVSLFAFILVLGVLVDDAIIVGESIYAQQAMYPGIKASVRGVMMVKKPVIVAAITTMIMFVPLLFLPGDEGRMLRAIPAVVIATLVFSLIESLLILPAHARLASPVSTTRSAISNPGLRHRWTEVLTKITVWTCRFPWLVQFIFLGFLLVVMLVASNGYLRYQFFAKIEGDLAVAKVTMVPGSSEQDVRDALDQLERVALELRSDHSEHGSEIKHVLRQQFQRSSAGVLSGEVAIEMSTKGDRETPAHVVAKKWRESVELGSGVESFVIQTSLNPERSSVRFYLMSTSRTALDSAAQQISEWLRVQPDVESIDLQGANPVSQVVLALNDYGRSLGFTVQEITRQVRVLLSNESLFDIRSDVGLASVKLQFGDSTNMYSIRALERLPVYSSSGQSYELGDLAALSMTDMVTDLRRHHGQASAEITVNFVGEPTGSWRSGQWRHTIAQVIETYFPEVRFEANLYQQEQAQIERYLVLSFMVALLAMYGLMAVVLESYWRPLLIVYAVPFGLAGAVLGHLLMQLPFTLYSLIGAFAVSGIVVNDNLVLLDRFQQKTINCSTIQDVIETVLNRARAVLLTTVTTVLGMLPLILDGSIQSQFLKPMAVSLTAGIIAATLVTLVLVPSVMVLWIRRYNY